ncbi:hypothetical protein AGABI2DRAFT_118479 [Agaricus bisporus var. bisporus H97]|uniref:hypothetical protein n=1 Tax=Agaricus bisporus var. bisporus (strain H97 / ATCC MYA-4626 / FGSC 10389) TaxID=936046 RepID=UPI00029F534A|nr:hypothetical protein AGABI2DRAFT_118479 [Agaricus bisporus var. bisporus H97]EKV46286.1 hypothetical protein AGABI2DRAFT_118479 [Agaricus bisporus var. bisporus H97]
MALPLPNQLYNIAQTVIPEVRDDSMEYVLANFDPEEIGDQFDSIRRKTPEIPRNWASARVSNPSNRTEGMGYTQPIGSDLFDIDRLGRYLLAHGRPGSQNFVYGTQLDYRRAVHRRSIFGYALARFFGPPETGRGRSRNGHVLFTRSLAILMASPQLYRDLIQEWNERHPDRLYLPQTGRVCYFRPMLLDDESVANINVDTVAEVLIHNGVPTEWIDHVYNFSVYYLNQFYNSDTNHQIIFDDADDERIRRLDLYGIPPAMPEWDGWRLPDDTDLIRCYYFEQRELEKFGADAPQRGYWEIAGRDFPPRLLEGRDYSIVDHSPSPSSTHDVTMTPSQTSESDRVDMGDPMEVGEIREDESNASTPRPSEDNPGSASAAS